MSDALRDARLDLTAHEHQYETHRLLGNTEVVARLGEELFLLRQQVRVMEEQAGVRRAMAETIGVKFQ